MELQPFGAARVVTGSCYSLKTAKHSILIDCGMFQGEKELERCNYQTFGFSPEKYEALLLTHAHLDHCGRIPKLVKEGFNGRIFCTDATRDLAKVIMLDAAKIQIQDTEQENRRRKREGLSPREPLYTEKEVYAAMKLFEVIKYDHLLKINNEMTAQFYDAGHILGASSIQIRVTEHNQTKTIVFSGDLGQCDSLLVNAPSAISEADYVVIESTYGDRLHLPVRERKNKFLRVIHESYKRHGKLMIPSFAIERTQELLYEINEFVEKRLMPKMNVYLDSPMAIKATEVFKKHPEYYKQEIKQLLDSGDNPFSFPGLIYTSKVDESIAINSNPNPCIIIAGSGMCTAGRIKHHIKHNIWDPKNTILFVGYQAKGSLGFYIKEGANRVKLLGTEVIVKAHKESIDTFSAHADYKGLLIWIKNFNPKPKRVFVTHGEEQAALSFAEKLQKRGIKAKVPKMRERILL